MGTDTKMEVAAQAPTSASAWGAVVPQQQQQYPPYRQQQLSSQPAYAGTKRVAADVDDNADGQPNRRHSSTSPPAPNKMPKLVDHHHNQQHQHHRESRDPHVVGQQLAQLSLTNPNINTSAHMHGPSLPPIITSSLISGGGTIGMDTSPIDVKTTSAIASWARTGAYSNSVNSSPESSSTTSGCGSGGAVPLFVDAASTTNVPSGTVIVPPAEPTLQRTLQAPYALDVSKWESRRAIPQYLTFNALASSPSGTLYPHLSVSSSQQLPTLSSSSPNASRAAHSYVSVPRGSRRTVVRYDEPALPPHPRAPLASHPEQKPLPSLAFAWGPSSAYHRPLTAENDSMAAFQRNQHKFCSRQGSVSAHASPTSVSSESFSGFGDNDDEEEDDEDDDDAMMAIDPTPTASSFNLSASGNGNPKDMVFHSYLPLPSRSRPSSVSAPASAISPVSSSLLPPPAQPIPDLSAQLAPFANAGPAGVHHWTTASISPQSRTHYPHHPYGLSNQQYPPQQHYSSRPSINNHTTGSSPLVPLTWNKAQQLPQQWSPTASYDAAAPPMGVWSEESSPVNRGRRM